MQDPTQDSAFIVAKPVIQKHFYYALMDNPKKSTIIMNAEILKFMNIKELQPGLIQYIDNIISDVLKHTPTFFIHIDLSTFKNKLVSRNVIKVIKILIKLFQDKYPDTLIQCTISNTPRVFRYLFKIIYYFLDNVTRKKIVIISKNNELLKTGNFADSTE